MVRKAWGHGLLLCIKTLGGFFIFERPGSNLGGGKGGEGGQTERWMRTKKALRRTWSQALGGRVKAARHSDIGSLCTVTWHPGTLREMLPGFDMFIGPKPISHQNWNALALHLTWGGDVMVTLILCSSRTPKIVPHMTPLSYAHGDWGLCA